MEDDGPVEHCETCQVISWQGTALKQLRLQRCEAIRVFQTLLTQRQLAERCTNLRVNKTGFETVKVGLNYVELTSF